MLQLAPEELPSEKLFPPLSLEAKVEIFLVTLLLWQVGQVTSLILFVLNTSVSNGFPHSEQTNSKMGMIGS